MMRANTVLVLACCLGSSLALAKGATPEDFLKGRVIVSDKALPMSWNSVGAYVSAMKNLNKSTLWYDKKTGKLTIHFAAFFAQPVQDVQVNLVIYDVTGGNHQQITSTENFMTRGDRVLFNSVVFDKEDIQANRKIQLAIEDRRRLIASVTFILRAEGPHSSGKVTFSDEEAGRN